jgi:hypothetical protein
MWDARNAYKILVGKPEGKRLVVKVFIASSEKSILEERGGSTQSS